MRSKRIPCRPDARGLNATVVKSGPFAAAAPASGLRLRRDIGEKLSGNIAAPGSTPASGLPFVVHDDGGGADIDEMARGAGPRVSVEQGAVTRDIGAAEGLRGPGDRAGLRHGSRRRRRQLQRRRIQIAGSMAVAPSARLQCRAGRARKGETPVPGGDQAGNSPPPRNPEAPKPRSRF